MARRLKDQSLGSVIADQLISGEGYGSSIGKAISLKTKARATRLKAKFDPLNIAKFMTGGSRLGPAIVGKLLGRSRKDIEYFTGRARPVSTSTKIGKLEGGGDSSGMDGMLSKIYEFMKKNREEDVRHREIQNNFAEEKQNEADRRHRELLKALGAESKMAKPTAEKVTTQAAEPTTLDYLFAAAGLGKDMVSLLFRVSKFFTATPLGAGLLLSYTLLDLLNKDKNPESTTKGMLAAGDVGEANKQMMDVVENTTGAERRKQNLLADRPKEFKSKLFWKEPELQKKYLEKIGFDEKTGLTEAEKNEGFIGVTDDGVPYKKAATPAPAAGSTPPAPAATPAGETGGAPKATPAASETGGVPAPTSTPPAPMATPETVPNMGQQLASVTDQNANMKLAADTAPLESVVNNLNSLNKSTTTGKSALPAVRNLEDTFQRMIMNSTRVV